MKTAFLDALLADLPVGVSDFMQTSIGTIPTMTIPTTKDDAIIACGKLSAHLNNFLLAPFSGLTPVELLLRIGQKNPVLISGLLAGLEVIAGEGGRLTILSPKDGDLVSDYDILFKCKGEGITAVTVLITPFGMELSLTDNAGEWEGGLTDVLPGGGCEATFTATYSDGSEVSKSVSFTMAEAAIVSTFPAAGQTYTPEALQTVQVTLNDIAAGINESITVSIFGVSVTMTKTTDTTYASETLTANFLDFIGANIMTVEYMAADGSKTRDIGFTLEIL